MFKHATDVTSYSSLFRTTKNAHIVLPAQWVVVRAKKGGGGGGYLACLRIRVGPKEYTQKKAVYPQKSLNNFAPQNTSP